jgi:hypothetical protein
MKLGSRILAVPLFTLLVGMQPVVAQEPVPAYTADGRLLLPADYRQWTFVTSGVDMSYSERPAMQGQSMFNNIFANPAAYQAFIKTGTWPDKTLLVMENRGAGSKSSINRNGHFQTPELMGLEVHVKDVTRFEGGWAFFAFDGTAPAKLIPMQADCYACHKQHAAVDTTFVQFYPTLLPIAEQKKTLSAEYVGDARGP